MFGVKEFVLEAGGVRMDCIAFGHGEKPLVLLQGLNTGGIRGSGMMLAWMYRLFAKERRVYLFDRRKEVGPGVTVRQLAADTAAAMDALGLRAADVFAVSQGGMIGQYLAIDRPDLVGRMVLAVTLSRNNDTVCETIENWCTMTQQGQMRLLIADMAERMYSPAYMKRYRPLLPLLTAVQRPKDVPRFLALAQACLTCEAYGELEKIRCPVLVLGGEKDRVVGAQASREIAEKLGCSLYLYEELGHAAYEEAADFNQRVYDFLVRSTE